MENNDNYKELKKNLYPSQNNMNDPNVINYLNQPFLPQPYMFGQNTPQYNINNNFQNSQNSQDNSGFDIQHNILYISNLPYNTNETDIKLFFKKYSDSITYMAINPRHFNQGETAPISAKVIFKDPITANNARIEMNLRKLKGHAIRLMWEERDNSVRYNSTTTNLFIKGIPFNVQPREVYEYFLQFGDISSAKLNEDFEGNHLGYGYVNYFDKFSAEEAIKNTNGKMMWGGGPLLVDYFKKKNERISTSGPEVFKVYVSNFPADYTKQDIIELTKEFGVILSITLSTEKVGRKYALVCYESEESAIKAKESLEGKNVCGYNLLCKLIKDKSNQIEHQHKNMNEKNNINKRFFQKPKYGYINNEQNMNNLYIKNIPFQIKEKEFNEIFGKYGKISSSKLESYNLLVNIGGQLTSVPTSKGFGYVCYEDPEVAKKVKDELNQQFLPGYEHWKTPLSISFFQTKSQKAMNNLINMNNENNINNFGFNNIQSNQNNEVLEFSMDKFKNICDEEKQKEYLGEYIVDYIFNSKILKDYSDEKQKEYNEKITGVILACGPLEQVAEMCQDEKLLNQNISQCLEMLINQNKKK